MAGIARRRRSCGDGGSGIAVRCERGGGKIRDRGGADVEGAIYRGGGGLRKGLGPPEVVVPVQDCESVAITG